MDYNIGDQVHHVDNPTATATVIRFPAFGRVVVCWDSTGRETEENEALMQRTDGAGMTWTTETLRSGIALEEASDDHGAMGVPGTWYRVRQGRDIALTTRNRGDALRLWQRRVRLVSGG
ncbi:hypothetical protein PV332_10680 [Streptomyces scabiei]|uniref:hypothetical protein n=1 Tax=Streptomyces scabiei TaxID=1930 RepID=UPI0029A76DC4|nr:hypothetical protein [Streptomyces scabiei]MDX2575946.1 hypothetical protein [Streptomyces scabiei]MDX2885581.1 hypothetical protein [Streptomyces scabiei]MDX2993466.1 hypothetical protein [Streptomyces scabiei]MDX3028420.1 hypothetical protein [Streptomyces scabiei]MDX3047246.1 hypothetical protein [Streptomyces scabiei]